MTLCELVQITEAHQAEAWDHTCHLLSAMAAQGGQEVDPNELNPFRNGLEAEEVKEDIGWLKMFVPGSDV